MRRAWSRPPLPTALAVLITAACTGAIAPGPGPGDPAAGGAGEGGTTVVGGAAGRASMGGAGGAPALPAEPLGPEAYAPVHARRLSVAQIRAAARDVFLGGKGEVALANGFPEEGLPRSFDDHDAGLSFSVGFADATAEHAEAVAAAAVSNLATLLPCDPVKQGDAACAGRFVDEFAPRVWRRPIIADEKARLLNVFTVVRAASTFAAGVEAVIATLLASPHFLLRTEQGDAARPIVRLTGHEVAASLSFFLWGSTPDDALLVAAADGTLGDAAGIERQARRLIADPRAAPATRDFVLQWLEASRLDAASRDAKQYPEWTADLTRALASETGAFVDRVVRSGGTLADLLTSPSTFANATTAKLYGLTANAPKGAAFEAVTLDANQRGGLFTQPAFLAAQSPPSGFSPVFLGRFFRRKVLCDDLPDPPADVPPVPPESPTMSTRSRFAAHTSSPSCSGCHALLDPVGFAFERYDGLGRYHETEHGTIPLTGEGRLQDTDVDGPIVGPVALARKLAASTQVETCFVAHLIGRSLGRDVVATDGRPVDDRAIVAARARAAAARGDLRELMIGVVTSDAFVFRDGRALVGGDR